MRVPIPRRGLGPPRSLTRQVALLSIVPMVALGLILARVLQSQIDARTLADATRTARLIAAVGVQPRLTPQGLEHGLTPGGVRALDRQLGSRTVRDELARIKIWNANDTVVYSDDHALIGRRLAPSDDLHDALAGRPHQAVVVAPRTDSETSGEVGLGKLVEVYVPLRFAAAGPPAGAFEIYLSYRPIAAAVAADKRTIALLVAVGLALLWAILYRIVAQASRRLRRQARENHSLARYDQLTGIPNRIRFAEGLRAALARAGAEGAGGAVIVVDIDRFGEINNTLGSAHGDRVLRETARRLRAALPPGTLVARLGADEYAVLCTRAEGAAGALQTASLIKAGIEQPLAVDGAMLDIEASMGIAITTGEDRDDPDAVLRRAGAALVRARRSWSRIEVYARGSDRFDPERLRLLGQVRGALERDELVLHYQPKLDLESGRVTGVEALLRWEHPDLGLLGPDRFVPVIEQTALIGPVTLYVLQHAVRDVTAWRRLGVDVELSVNLSARNLLDPGLPDLVDTVLSAHGIPADRLTVEVTESAMVTDRERAVRVLAELRARGVRVSVDDFGTGHASIEYLAALPADEIKIDRSFVTGILDDPRADAIVRSTVELARHLRLSVVAEGIETAAVLDHVTALGCDIGQGYFIARPLPEEALLAQLTASFGVGAASLSPRPGTQGAEAPAYSASGD